jgi:hypothetical protein
VQLAAEKVEPGKATVLGPTAHEYLHNAMPFQLSAAALIMKVMKGPSAAKSNAKTEPDLKQS